MLDGVVVRLFEVFMPEDPNSYCHTLYYRNHAYELAEVVDSENYVGESENLTIVHFEFQI